LYGSFSQKILSEQQSCYGCIYVILLNICCLKYIIIRIFGKVKFLILRNTRAYFTGVKLKEWKRRLEIEATTVW